MRRFALVTLAICLGLLPVAHTFGQSNGSSISDIGQQVLQGMSPDQRDQIMNQLGLGNGNNTGSQGLGTRRQNPEDLNDIGQQGLRRLTPEQQEEMDRLSPFLQPQDWVVITIDVNPLPASGSTSNLQQQLSANPGAVASLLGGLQQNQSPGGAANLPAGAPGQTAGTAGNPLTPSSAALAAAAASASQSSSATTATAGGYAPAAPAQPGQLRSDSNATPPVELTDEQKATRQRLIDLIRSKNPYQLSRDGMLSLPGFAPIPLAGLT
jgi:hypothetical protein